MTKNVVIAGASGLIGTALKRELETEGWNVTPLARGEAREGEATWSPDTFSLDPQVLAGQDAVVCLNGAPLAKWPWTHEYKHELVDSRLKPVTTLVNALNSIDEAERPEVFLSASAVGYYGSRGNEVLEEDAQPASDFLGGLCQVWEAAASKAKVSRVVNVRTGLVLHDDGGMLATLKPLFKSYLGSQLGDGRQWMPTISLRDHVRAIRFLLESEQSGPFNLTGPEPCTNAEFTKGVAEHLDRFPAPPVPAPIIRIILGDMSVIALSSQYVTPSRLLDAGFTFKDGTLEEQLRAASSAF